MAPVGGSGTKAWSAVEDRHSDHRCRVVQLTGSAGSTMVLVVVVVVAVDDDDVIETRLRNG